MVRRFTILVLVSGLLLAALPASAAGNVIHYSLTGAEDSSMPLDDLESCVGYAGAINEQRSYDYRISEFVSGPRQGQVRLNGVVMGDFTIVPDDAAAGPTYSGSYREKVTLAGDSLDDPRVVSFHLPGSATGSDGSRLKFLLHGHMTVGADGQVIVAFQKINCIQSPA